MMERKRRDAKRQLIVFVGCHYHLIERIPDFLDILDFIGRWLD